MTALEKSVCFSFIFIVDLLDAVGVGNALAGKPDHTGKLLAGKLYHT